jgi:hypothetical protein
VTETDIQGSECALWLHTDEIGIIGSQHSVGAISGRPKCSKRHVLLDLLLGAMRRHQPVLTVTVAAAASLHISPLQHLIVRVLGALKCPSILLSRTRTPFTRYVDAGGSAFEPCRLIHF